MRVWEWRNEPETVPMIGTASAKAMGDLIALPVCVPHSSTFNPALPHAQLASFNLS